MGSIVPPTWPTLIDDKWYCCTLECYQGGGPPYDCTQNYVGQATCCQTGAIIKGWQNAGLECAGGWELCVFSGYTAQRLIGVVGPYDNFGSCDVVC